MKFEYRNGLLYSPITINYNDDVELKGLIDTGSAGTVVDINCFDVDILSRDARSVCVIGVGGFQEAFAQTVSSVKLGSSLVHDFEIEFCDLKDDFGFEAIIGSVLLEQLGAKIDFPNRELSFSAN